jgi:hypothetical protein
LRYLAPAFALQLVHSFRVLGLGDCLVLERPGKVSGNRHFAGHLHVRVSVLVLLYSLLPLSKISKLNLVVMSLLLKHLDLGD